MLNKQWLPWLPCEVISKKIEKLLRDFLLCFDILKAK